MNQFKFDGPDLYDDMTTAITAVISIVAAAIVAAICGGTGLALIMSGPIGWIIGAIIGFITVWVGKEVAKGMVEDVDLPKSVIGILLTKKKLDKLLLKNRSEFKSDIRLKVLEQFEKPIDDLLNKVEDRIDKEIDCIDAIDQL